MPQDMNTRYGHTESWNYGVTELRSCGVGHRRDGSFCVHGESVAGIVYALQEVCFALPQ